jgi:hypothetical protein
MHAYLYVHIYRYITIYIRLGSWDAYINVFELYWKQLKHWKHVCMPQTSIRPSPVRMFLYHDYGGSGYGEWVCFYSSRYSHTCSHVCTTHVYTRRAPKCHLGWLSKVRVRKRLLGLKRWCGFLDTDLWSGSQQRALSTRMPGEVQSRDSQEGSGRRDRVCVWCVCGVCLCVFT